MATPAQIAANRQNAQKSTGPRTDEGKAAVARNAVTHGLTAANPTLPGENREAFEGFRDAVVADVRPQGILQQPMAERIAHVHWKLRRLPELEVWSLRSMQVMIFGDGNDIKSHFARDLGSCNSKLSRLQLYEQRL